MPQPPAGAQVADAELNERIGTGVSLGIVNMYSGQGVPPNALGTDGSFYFRYDGGAGTAIYQRRAGVWVATAA